MLTVSKLWESNIASK